MKRARSGVYYHLTRWNIFEVRAWGTVWMLPFKSASTSIRRALATQLGLPTEDVHRLTPFQGLDKHGAQAFQRNGYLVIGSVRHPVARLASCWYDKVYRAPFYVEFQNFSEFRPGMSFVDFVDAVADIPDEDAEPHFRSQSFDLVDEGRVIPDVLIDQSTILADWNRVRAHVAVRTSPHVWLPDLTWDNRNPWRDDIGEVPERTLVVIRERFADDFAAFGYDSDPGSIAELLRGRQALAPSN